MTWEEQARWFGAVRYAAVTLLLASLLQAVVSEGLTQAILATPTVDDSSPRLPPHW
jgi:hypothetical protein